MNLTQTHVNLCFSRMTTAAGRAGVPGRWTLHNGSSTNGVSWKVIHDNHTIELGMSRREAAIALGAMEEAYLAVAAIATPRRSVIDVANLPSHLLLALRRAATETEHQTSPNDARADYNTCVTTTDRLDIEMVRRGYASVRS